MLHMDRTSPRNAFSPPMENTVWKNIPPSPTATRHTTLYKKPKVMTGSCSKWNCCTIVLRPGTLSTNVTVQELPADSAQQ
jgi:hypothetical protein